MLKPLERELAVWRLEKEAGSGEGSESTSTWQGFVEGFKDPKVSTVFLTVGANSSSMLSSSAT